MDWNEKCAFDDELRAVEAKLEELGRSICSKDGSAPSWGAINRAISDIGDAIHCSRFMVR